jgi:hypothetical protein
VCRGGLAGDAALKERLLSGSVNYQSVGVESSMDVDVVEERRRVLGGALGPQCAIEIRNLFKVPHTSSHRARGHAILPVLAVTVHLLLVV